MKAHESLPNYESKLRESTNFVIKHVKKVCKDIGPRESAEANERKAQEYVAETMKPFADDIQIEGFDVHPKAFMGWVLIDGSFMLLSVMLMCLSAAFSDYSLIFRCIALALACLSVVLMVGEFLFYRELLDPLFPKRQSCNVVCKKEPKGETKRRIIFAGHIDSAYEWTYTHLGGSALLKTVIIYGIGGMVITLILDIIALILGNTTVASVLCYAQLAFVPAFIMVLFFVGWKQVVTGANDNLTGVFGSMAVMQFLNDNGLQLENTELVCVSTGCEEAGLRGAKAFAKQHSNEYSDIDTLFVAVDTLRDFDYLGVYRRDMTSIVKLDTQGSALCKKACENAGLDIPYATVPFGSSDAAAAQQGGLRATCVAAMDPAPPRYYHTRDDLPSILVPKTIEAGLNILLESAFLFDEQGFKDNY